MEKDDRLAQLLKQLSDQEQQEARAAEAGAVMKIAMTGPDGVTDEFDEFFSVGFQGKRAQVAGKCTLLQMLIARKALDQRIQEAMPTSGVAGVILAMMMRGGQ